MLVNKMFGTVKILIEGCTNADSMPEIGKERTRPTITLVRDENIVMVVDPGILENQQDLVDALQKENLTIEDVNIVCITHSHIDHYRNIGMFPRAKTLEYYGMWDKESVESWSENFSANIRVLATPGHDRTGISLFVKTSEGVVAICGDVFWKENYPEDVLGDLFASDHEKLAATREMILKMADWIIPGHGGMYKNDKSRFADDEETIEIIHHAHGAIEQKNILICRKCHKQMERVERCICRPWLCYRCCECGIDCDTCSCSHKHK